MDLFSAGSSLTYHLVPFVLHVIRTSHILPLLVFPKALRSRPSTLHHVHYPSQHSDLFPFPGPAPPMHLQADDTQLFFSFHPLTFDSSISHLQTLFNTSLPGWLLIFLLFSGRELAFTFAICYRRSVCRLPVCLWRWCALLSRLKFSAFFFTIR